MATPKAIGSSQKKAPTDTGTKPKPIFKHDLFRAAVAAKIWECLNDEKAPAYATDGPEVQQAIEMFVANFGKDVDEYGSAVEAASVFSDWIELNPFTYTEILMYIPTSYSIALTAQTKSGAITLTMNFNVDPDSAAEGIAQAKKHLAKQFADALGSQQKQLSLPETVGTKKTYDTEEWDIASLRANMFNGKMTYHVIPSEGKWVQFGMPLYPDIAKKFGIELPDEEGDYELSGTATIELKDDGKPRRVISIV